MLKVIKEYSYMSRDKTSTFLKDTFLEIIKKRLEEAESVEEAKEITKKLEKIDLGHLFKEMFLKMADDTTQFLKNTMYEEVMAFRAEEEEFIVRQEQKWYRGFVASEAMYIIVLESAEDYVNYVNTLSNKKKLKYYNTFTAMLHIHGRALQEFLEIITLMKNGFADGAYARWRSMYELSIIASFITENGENVAKAFIEASETEDRYEWARASGLFSNKKRYISFNDIQTHCDINTKVWRKQYDLANKTVHASPQGTFARLGNMKTENIIPVGRSDYGITTPAEHSAISLAQITSMFLSIFPYGDGIVAMRNITNWIDVIREIYFKIHDEVFPEDSPLWENDLEKCIDEE